MAHVLYDSFGRLHQSMVDMSSHIAVLEQNVADLTGKIGSPQLLSGSQTDPITTKKIADVDDK